MGTEPSGKPGPGQEEDLLSSLRGAVNKAGEAVGELARQGAQVVEQLARDATQKAQDALETVPRRLGEDYCAILETNPLILDTLSRAPLLVENRELLSTAFNLPWSTTLLWSTAAGGTIALQRPIAQVLGSLLHYGPGHIKHWDEISRFMDSAVGVGHRLKFGHSIDYLPQIVEKFGIDGVPAYFMHLLQDFMTADGIPTVPGAWDIKETLQLARVPRKVATGLVSASFSSTLGALAVITLVSELWTFADALVKKVKTRRFLKTAGSAIKSQDYNAAVSNYQRALEIERSPYVLMALGQVYMQRASTRLRAHQSFAEAVTLLADQPDVTAPYSSATLSVRGLAGMQALATADVLANIHPEHWNDYVKDMVNATVFSFASAASKQATQSEDLVPDRVVSPALLSSAINYYLAARSASYYPFTEEKQDKVLRNIKGSLRCLGLMAQYDEIGLRPRANTLRQLWVMEVLPPEEIETALATY